MKSYKALIVTAALTLLVSSRAWATNGMNLEGYGPMACSMGGVSMAFDNGTAAVMNNPATLGLMSATMRLDLALGTLGPNVDASVLTRQGALKAHSAAEEFYMPAGGWVRKQDSWVYGLAVFGQGGMGTEYNGSSWMADPSQGANTALSAGLLNRSEVSLGRVLVPVAYQVNNRVIIGATVDGVWAGMDLQMALAESQFIDLTTTHQSGTASGTLTQSFGQLYEPFGGQGISRLHHAYFDFHNSNDFTGAAKAVGWGAKLGLVYSVNSQVRFGATYHTPTYLGDLDTGDALMRMGVNMDTGMLSGVAPSGEYMDANIPVEGRIVIEDFEWPAVIGAGLAYQPNQRLLLAFDVRHIQWAGVMEDFKMHFVADVAATNGGFSGQDLTAVLFQDWDDQWVYSIGGQYQLMDGLEVRAGYNTSNNPVPDNFLNALFPAIVEDHLTFGMGYALSKRSKVELAVSKGLRTESTNPGNGSTIPAVTSSHSQLNTQLMYSYLF